MYREVEGGWSGLGVKYGSGLGPSSCRVVGSLESLEWTSKPTEAPRGSEVETGNRLNSQRCSTTMCKWEGSPDRYLRQLFNLGPLSNPVSNQPQWDTLPNLQRGWGVVSF